MERDRYFVLANALDWRVERDLVAIDAKAALAKQGDKVTRGHRAEQLAGFGGLAQNGKALAVEFPGHLIRIGLERERARFELAFHLFKARAVFVRGAQRLAARQQKIAGEPVLDAHDIAHLAKASDALEQNDFHGDLA